MRVTKMRATAVVLSMAPCGVFVIALATVARAQKTADGQSLEPAVPDHSGRSLRGLGVRRHESKVVNHGLARTRRSWWENPCMRHGDDDEQ